MRYFRLRFQGRFLSCCPSFAISLACEPELLITGEPTTALDVTIQAQVLAMMKELKDKLGTSMIMITHDLGIVAETCDKVAVMYAGEIVESGTVEDIFNSEKHHPYTEGLFGSIPRLDVETKRLKPIDGMIADPNLVMGIRKTTLYVKTVWRTHWTV